jgi:hypothetical protein
MWRNCNSIEVARGKSWSLRGTVAARLVDALAGHGPQRPAAVDQAYLDQMRQSALVLLYRLLFVVYAEDRDLLPAVRQSDADVNPKRAKRSEAPRACAVDGACTALPARQRTTASPFHAAG